MGPFARTFIVLACLASAGCRAPLEAADVDASMYEAMVAARGHVEAGRHREAYQLTTAVARVDAEYPGLDELEMDEATTSIDRGWAGSNVAYRTPDPSPWWGQILWYLPDRLLDVLDLFSFDVHLGLGAYVDVHLTHWVGMSLGYRGVAGLGWHDQRSFGGQVRAETTASLFPFGAEAGTMARAGTSGVRGFSGGDGGITGPMRERYQQFDDFWALGAHVTAGVVGVDVDIHPLEIFDLLVGFVLFDPLNDDFASSDGLDMSKLEWQLIRDLLRASADDELLAEYRALRAEDAAGAAGDVPMAPG